MYKSYVMVFNLTVTVMKFLGSSYFITNSKENHTTENWIGDHAIQNSLIREAFWKLKALNI